MRSFASASARPVRCVVVAVTVVLWVIQLSAPPARCDAGRAVRIEQAPSLAGNPVIADAVADLQNNLTAAGFTLADPHQAASTTLRLALAEAGLPAVAPQQFTWEPILAGSEVSAGTLSAPNVMSLNAAIFWLSDRIACSGKIPGAEHRAVRAFTRSITSIFLPKPTAANTTPQAIEAHLAQFRQTGLRLIRYGITDILIGDFNYVLDWGAGSSELAKGYQQGLRQTIKVAHSMGLRAFLYGDEFIYSPDSLKASGARLSTSDPKFWKYLADKHRAILRAVPELDGIESRAGEIIPWPGVQALDLMHDTGDHGERSLVQNYHEFMRTLDGVIVGEFGKTYIHRTWVTNNWEQHNVPDIYKAIFTPDIPTANYISSIKLTSTDGWEYQPINPTFGVTPHATLAELQTGGVADTVCDYSLGYIQAGMQYALEHGAVGLAWGAVVGTEPLYESVSYAAWRLSWTPRADLTEILGDWARRRLGPVAASEVPHIFLTLGDIFRDNWYLRPVAIRVWTPQPLVNVDFFVVKGNPLLDQGSGQDRFLRDLYLSCKPWLRETMSEVGEGVERYDEIIREWTRLRPVLADPAVGEQLARRFRRAREAMDVYRAYVQTFLICYAYRDTPTQQLHDEFAYRLADLTRTFDRYQKSDPAYRPMGIRVFLDIARRTLANPDRLEKEMKDAPTADQIEQKLKADESHDDALARQYPNAETFFSWTGAVDGRDVLVLQGDKLSDDHWVANYPDNVQAHVTRPLPQQPLQYFIVRQAGRGWMTLLEAPSAENGWTAKIFVDDPLPGTDVYRFELRGVEK
jgi:hypothetical protein